MTPLWLGVRRGRALVDDQGEGWKRKDRRPMVVLLGFVPFRSVALCLAVAARRVNLCHTDSL